jgi:hypothetical protein
MSAGRTHWRRFGVVMVLSTAATAGLVSLVASGAVAASFVVSGQQFKVQADKLVADHFVQYGAVALHHEPGSPPDDRFGTPVAVSAMQHATLTNLCQSVFTDIGPLAATLVIHAGKDPKHPVTAENLTIDMTQLDGNAEFTNIEIGKDAHFLDTWTNPDTVHAEVLQRQEGFFSQQASNVTITDLKQTAWATSAGKFNLVGLSLSLELGKHECFPG